MEKFVLMKSWVFSQLREQEGMLTVSVSFLKNLVHALQPPHVTTYWQQELVLVLRLLNPNSRQLICHS